MALLCETIQIRLVARDRSRQCDITDRATWRAEALRSRIATTQIDVDMCACIDDFVAWSDLIEYHLGETLLMRYLYRGSEPLTGGRVRVRGVGLVAQLNRRNHPTELDVTAPAVAVWRDDLFSVANQIEPTFLTPQIDSAVLGDTATFTAPKHQTMLQLHDKLAGVHLVYGEHSGGIETRADGDENGGPQIHPRWLVGQRCGPPAIDSDSTVNELALQYGPNDQVITWPPEGLADADRNGSRLQSPLLLFPEIADETTAYQVIERLHGRLSRPQVILNGIELDARRVDWRWLVPGRNHISGLPGSEGVLANLDSVELDGTGPAVRQVFARWDQTDIASVLNRVRA